MKVLMRLSFALALSAPLAVLAPAHAETLIPLTALLNGPQQEPMVNSPSQGVALVLLVKETNTVCWRISYSPLVGTESGAHFHGPAAPGQNAAIIISIVPPGPIGSPKHGCAVVTKDQAKMLTKGLMYINIHSLPDFGTGEIRGQVLPLKVKYKNVPAPASPVGAFLE